jgi:hypothetical protein
LVQVEPDHGTGARASLVASRLQEDTMAPAPHLTEALRDARDFAARFDDEPGWLALEAQAERVLDRLGIDEADPGYADVYEAEGIAGPELDPDVVDRAVASLTAVQEQPHEEQLAIAQRAMTDLEHALP